MQKRSARPFTVMRFRRRWGSANGTRALMLTSGCSRSQLGRPRLLGQPFRHVHAAPLRIVCRHRDVRTHALHPGAPHQDEIHIRGSAAAQPHIHARVRAQLVSAL